MFYRVVTVFAGTLLLAACAEEPPPPSVQQMVEDSILLEAAMVRCSRDRLETRYEGECVNAREAIKIIEAREDAERRKAFEARSNEKREALRRTQAAAAEARRRAAEEERLREEAEYLAQFGELPPDSLTAEKQKEAVNAPGAVIPEAAPVPSGGDRAPVVNPFDDVAAETQDDLPVGNANVPAAVVEETVEEEPASDLEAVREELKKRQQQN